MESEDRRRWRRGGRGERPWLPPGVARVITALTRRVNRRFAARVGLHLRQRFAGIAAKDVVLFVEAEELGQVRAGAVAMAEREVAHARVVERLEMGGPELDDEVHDGR